MFKFKDLRQIHLEVTNNCQASCPMCTRNIHGGLDNPLLHLSNWSLEKYKSILTSTVLNQVWSIYFCGNFGDPLLNNDLLDMIEYSKQTNPNIDIRVHTNGSLRSSEWWKRLAEVLPEKHAVIFALDGLEDTHQLYRIGTDFDKIISNAKTFIDAGGKAEWHYIRFKHNEHQVEAAKAIAVDMGFKHFVMKDSSRWMLDTKFPVYNKQGATTHYLEPSQYSELKFIDRKVIDNYKEVVKATTIDCYALDKKEIYIDAQGHVFPCCWLAMIPYIPFDHEKEVFAVKQEILKQYHELVESLGGYDAIDGTKKPVNEIIDSNEYQSVWSAYWGENKLITCARSCGRLPEVFSTPNDQFTARIELKQ